MTDATVFISREHLDLPDMKVGDSVSISVNDPIVGAMIGAGLYEVLEVQAHGYVLRLTA